MAEPNEMARDQPLVKPRLIRFLKNRRKLIGGQLRTELWSEVDKNVTQRRKPDTMAEKTVQRLLEEIQEASFPVMRERVRNRMERSNERALRRL